MGYLSVHVGHDPRFTLAYQVAVKSLQLHASERLPVYPLTRFHLEALGYTRPTEVRDGLLYDVISEHPMATEFAITRFFVPWLEDFYGWSLFIDSDMLFRADVMRLFELRDPRKAVQVVKHDYDPPEGEKMDGQVQSRYARKNWSSVMLFNNAHPANRCLRPDGRILNTWPGRDLHAFRWLTDDLIGDLPVEWNFLEGHHDPDEINPALVHYTRGTPDIPGYEAAPFAQEWRYVANELTAA